MTFQVAAGCCRDRYTHPRHSHRNDSQGKCPLNVVCGQDRVQHDRKERSHHSHNAEGQGLLHRVMHLAQKQHSNLQHLFTPQTHPVTPSGYGGVNTLLLIDRKTEAQLAPEHSGGQKPGSLLQVMSQQKRSRLPHVVPTAIPTFSGRCCESRARKAKTKHAAEPARRQQHIPGCQHRPGAQRLGLASLPPRVSSAELSGVTTAPLPAQPTRGPWRDTTAWPPWLDRGPWNQRLELTRH